MDRNAPPDTVMIRWAATSAPASASSRLAGSPASPAPADSLSTWTVSRAACHGPGSGVARTDTVPASSARRRTTRAPSVVSTSSPPGTVNRVTRPPPNRASAVTVAVTSCSTASSHTAGALASWTLMSRTIVSPVLTSPVLMSPVPAASLAPLVRRRCTCRKRRVTSTAGWPRCSKTHSARIVEVSDGSAAA